MSHGTIMVHLEWDVEVDARVRLAAGLADRLNSELIGINAWMPRPRPLVEPEVEAREFEHLKAVAQSANDRFRQKIGVGDRKVDCLTFLEFPTECISREMRAADLLVIGREFGVDDPYLYPDTKAVVLKAGRPVLVVPPGKTSLPLRRAVIAWKDTREARRAVADAMPLLKEVQEVIVTEVCQFESEVKDSQSRLRDVIGHLSRHGVSPVVERVRPFEGTAENSLLTLIQGSSADLVVAGAYGHSRLGEWMFGGVTLSLFEKCPVCCLFSH
jgi:nucleotide-binding universal stress UspA family protein